MALDHKACMERADNMMLFVEYLSKSSCDYTYRKAALVHGATRMGMLGRVRGDVDEVWTLRLLLSCSSLFDGMYFVPQSISAT